MRVKWNRTGSVGRVFFRRGRTRKIAEVMAGGVFNHERHESHECRPMGRGIWEPRKTRTTRNVGVAEECSGEPSIVIGECFGCEFRNSFVSSDPSASGVARGSVVSGRWPIGGRLRGTPGTNAKTTLGLKSALQALRTNFWGCRRPRAAPWATGKRPFRPESQTRAEHKPNTRTQGLAWFRVSGFGFRVSGFGFRVSGVGGWGLGVGGWGSGGGGYRVFAERAGFIVLLQRLEAAVSTGRSRCVGRS